MGKRALLSVYDKKGIVDFATGLVKKGYTIISTGGTAAKLKQNGIAVVEVSEVTEFPEMLNGRVKTLHPRLFGGILAEQTPDHEKQLQQHHLDRIELVCVNLYPFLDTVLKNSPLKEIIGNIDIGGPSLIRAAAKNFRSTLVITDPKDYVHALEKIDQGIDDEYRSYLATKAFAYTARYDVMIHRFFHKYFSDERFPDYYNFTFEKIQNLRYGENPHQQAAVYKPYLIQETGVPTAKQLQGKELSYNNILDANEALSIVRDFKAPTAAIIKHTNPCGVASAPTIEEAFTKAHRADPKSAFGCIVALNRSCTRALATLMQKMFIEVVIAPTFEQEAVNILSKKKKLRLLETGDIINNYEAPEMRRISSGLLVQTRQFPTIGKDNLKVVTKKKPTPQQMKDLIFSWKVNKHVKSNAVVFAKNEVTVGIGAGQMSRVDAVNLVMMKEESDTKSSVMSSDAYFPFRDGLDQAVKAGAKAIIQPGGSIRDQEVIDAANEHGIAMVFSNVRLFKH